jgi:hypothetical protein
MNKSDKRAEKEAKISSIDDIVEKAENSSKHDRDRNNIDIITTTCELYRQGIL